MNMLRLENGSVEGRHYQTGEWMGVQCRSGLIERMDPLGAPGVPSGRASGPWLLPALVDLQVNGFAGVDFQSDSLTVEDLKRAASGLRQAGCSRWFLTLITDDWERLLKRLERLATLVGSDPVLRAAVAGWHVEGPFLSGETGYRGAHESQWMRDPTPGAMEALRARVGSDPLLVTLAPERSGAVESIREAVRLGIRISLGHTDASVRQLEEAMEAGASGFTHWGNGCPSMLHRHDNILVRVLDSGLEHVMLIPDGIHVPGPFFRLAHRILGGRVLYVSDAMAAAGAGVGRYRLKHMELEVGEDEVVRLPGASHFAGSALRPWEGVRRAASMLGQDWRTVWDRFSVKPAGWMGLKSGLAVGAPADFCLVPADESKA